MQEIVVVRKTPDGVWSLNVDGEEMATAVRDVRIEIKGSEPQAEVWLMLPRAEVHFEGPAFVNREAVAANA